MTAPLRFFRATLRLLPAFAVLGAAAPASAAKLDGLMDRGTAVFSADSLRTAGADITADRMTADAKSGLSVLDGHVRVRFSDITLTCDRATYNRNSGDIHAEGHVHLESASGGSWDGDSIDFNHRTGEGLVGAGILRLGTFTVLADSTAMDDDGVFHARRATLTTCNKQEQHDWHWSVTGTARYKDREFVEMRNVTFRAFDIPVLWLPYYYRDLNTHYGFRIRPGYASDEGAYLYTAYVYPIAGSQEQDGLLYGKTAVDLRSSWGAAVGQELTWRTYGTFFDEDVVQSGRIGLYYAWHTEDQDWEDLNWQSPYNEGRWSVRFRERMDFGPRDFVTVTGERVSDSEFRTDYKRASVLESSEPVGIANYEHRENSWVGSVAVSGPLNTFYAGVQRLPEVRLDVLPTSFFGLDKHYYESQTTVSFLERNPAKYDRAWDRDYFYRPGVYAFADTTRVDTRHMIRRPIALGEGITLTPRNGWRGTYYTDSPEGDSIFRSLFEFGARLEARYRKDYDSGETAVRHTFRPYVDFTWVPGSEDDPDDTPYSMDRLDAENEWRDRYASDGMTPNHRYTGVRFGLLNVFEQKKDRTFSPLFDFDLYGVYVFKTQDHWSWRGADGSYKRANLHRVKEEDGLRVIGFTSAVRVSSSLSLHTDIQFDPEESRLAFADINATWDVSKNLTLFGGFLTHDHETFDTFWDDYLDDRVVYAGATVHCGDSVDFSAYFRYNLELHDLEEIGGYVQYNLDCISFRLGTSYEPSYDREDGSKVDSDVRISLGAWLRAFPKDDDDDWVEWGEYE